MLFEWCFVLYRRMARLPCFQPPKWWVYMHIWPKWHCMTIQPAWIFVYASVCMCVHVCAYVCMYVCVSISKDIKHICNDFLLWASKNTKNKFISIHFNLQNIHACIYVCVCMCVCMYVCMCVCVYVCMYVCVYVCALINISVELSGTIPHLGGVWSLYST